MYWNERHEINCSNSYSRHDFWIFVFGYIGYDKAR